jgi:hypothetical protein
MSTDGYIPSLALIVKAINPVNGGTLMVSSDHEEILGVLNLVRKKQADALQTLHDHI